MSTARRPLGLGPATAMYASSDSTPPRLLPVERADPAALLGDVEHQDVVGWKGRRNLGPGTQASPEGVVGK
ncbi:hypothetical protein ACWD5R_43755 [Streptomyces sp. NPDC002514]